MNAGSGTTRLLLVDDDEFVRGALTRALNQTGAFSVVPAKNGEQALELLAREQIDAVLTDLQMPTMDGLTLLGHLFERGIRLPVAVMTGKPIAADLARRLHEYGIAASFVKPVDVGTLADALQRSLDPETVGNIRGITLFGLLQLLEVERKTALVVVRASDREGRLYFDDGNLTHAHTPRLSGLDAAYEVLGWPDPTVEIFYRRRSRQRTVTVPLQHVLMEAARLLDERGQEQDPASAERVPMGIAGREPAAAPATRAEASPGRRGRSGAPAPQGQQGPQRALEEMLGIPGALGAALVHAASGMTLGEAGGNASLDMAVAAAAATDVVRAELDAIAALQLDDVVQDMMITLGRQYHLIAFTGGAQDVFVYLVLDRDGANLGMARHQLARLARDIDVQ